MAGTCDLLRTQRKILLFKLETTEGEDAAPTPALNAVLVNSVEAQPQPNLLPANELRGLLDVGEFDVGGFPVQLPITVNLKPGPDNDTPPEAGPLLEACGLGKTEVEEIVGTATGGSTTTVTVDRSIDTDFPADEGALVGRVIAIEFATPVVSLIKSYSVTGSTVTIGLAHTLAVAPTNQPVDVSAGIIYKPSEACPPSGTAYLYDDGVLKKYTGCRGTASWTMGAGGRPELTVNLIGRFLSKADVALPTSTVVYQDVRPGIWRGGIMAVDSVKAAVATMSIALNNTTPTPGDPNEQEGFLPAVITARDIQGTIDPLDTLVATRDIFTDFRNGVKRAIAALIPGVGGHYTGITVPAAKYRGEGPVDREGLMAVNAPFSAINEGADNPEKGDVGLYLTFSYYPPGS